MTQLLMDFGQSANALKESESVIEQTKQQHLAARQGLILEVLTAYLSVQRAQEVLDSAIKAENNIKNQASLEDALVDAGKGYRSDVLHAKAQLASAQARRVRAEGSLDVAKARMEAVCGDLYPKVRYSQKINYLSKDLPKSLSEAKKVALENNLQLRVGSARSQALSHRYEAARIEDKAPKVELVTQIERNWDADGVLRRKRDDRFMVQVSWDQNFGSAETNRLGSIQQDLEASRQREQETIQLVGEQVLIAWRNFTTANNNEEIIKNQVELARQFLDAARQERKAGRRSLLDVLSAETRVLDAEADLFATSYDKKIAAFTLMQAVGILDLKHIAVLTK
ncbi:MAG: TolC family protein [Candidatus Cloacimonetes bacterium]|nr:TolC family protein [Candidatus Cloacimonadota bacterium]